MAHSPHSSPGDLSQVAREHFEVARTFPGWFRTGAFIERYRATHPGRAVGSMIPSDYCFNSENGGNAHHPRFLIRGERAMFRFADLDGRATETSASARASAPAQPVSPRVLQASPVTSPRRVAATVGASTLTLDEQEASNAIRAYNTDPDVQRNERRVYCVLPEGFERGQVKPQLQVLSAAYRTRTPVVDRARIASAIEAGFDRWSETLLRLPRLEEGVPDAHAVETLLGHFVLLPSTSPKPRSLATKALFFAAPRAFIPVDDYAAGVVAPHAGLRPWGQMTGGVAEFATWYCGYLTFVHALAGDAGLVDRLVVLDQQTDPDPIRGRTRGWPKIFDKAVWWVGAERRRGRTIELFT